MITIIPDPQPSASDTPAVPPAVMWDPAEMCDAFADHPFDRNRQLFCWLRAGHKGAHHDEVDHVMWTAQPLGDVAELNARRTAAAAVLGDYKAALASAPVTQPPGREWMLRLASVLEDLLDVLDEDARHPAESRATVAAFDEVARILAAFDWEHDERQLALEAIERAVLTGGQPDDDEDQGDEDDDEPYCYQCGSPVGIFIGHGDAWLHYRGEGTVADPVELFDAGHAPEVAWRPAGAR